MALKDNIIKQIELVQSRYDKLRSVSHYPDLSDLDAVPELTSLITIMCDTVRRFAPVGSQYADSLHALIKTYHITNPSIIPRLVGLLSALKDAYRLDFLTSSTEMIHAALFSDFIEMAEYLLKEGYKDPAAVIVGSVLEEHLRQLCEKSGIPTEQNGRPKKADQINADLASANVYSKLDQKSLTGWLDLRNKAAHGKYGEYTEGQVSLLLQSVRDFMARVPA